jgi:hypothetical protein
MLVYGLRCRCISALALTDREIRALTPRSRRYRVSDGGGLLLLEVDQAGGKSWMWRHRFPPTKDGRQQDLRLGPYPWLSLKAARQKRDEQKLLLQEQGIDPCKAKKLMRSEQWSQAAGPMETAEQGRAARSASPPGGRGVSRSSSSASKGSAAPWASKSSPYPDPFSANQRYPASAQLRPSWRGWPGAWVSSRSVSGNGSADG